ncbi:probable N-acetyltransferase HLS1-like [Glycine soja]|uniref:probable N-acetyltransferase HLS1-like n=1 Tax=Glycine soja TaxID=3848 RepID=UPI0010407E4E|nr:probable N-acetyltransferase HLS1-like [Glycine soja]
MALLSCWNSSGGSEEELWDIHGADPKYCLMVTPAPVAQTLPGTSKVAPKHTSAINAGATAENLVAELLDTRELVVVVRGIIKNVGTLSGPFLKMGCILGLRVSPTYRRKRVALRLVTATEEWMVRNGVEYALLATENNNDASKNLFTIKSNYVNLSSLVIFVQPTSSLTKKISMDIKIDKVDIDLAISLYKRTMRTKDLYPLDMDVILKEKLNLRTWVCYYKEEG